MIGATHAGGCSIVTQTRICKKCVEGYADKGRSSLRGKIREHLRTFALSYTSHLLTPALLDPHQLRWFPPPKVG